MIKLIIRDFIQNQLNLPLFFPPVQPLELSLVHPTIVHPTLDRPSYLRSPNSVSGHSCPHKLTFAVQTLSRVIPVHTNNFLGVAPERQKDIKILIWCSDTPPSPLSRVELHILLPKRSLGIHREPHILRPSHSLGESLVRLSVHTKTYALLQRQKITSSHLWAFDA